MRKFERTITLIKQLEIYNKVGCRARGVNGSCDVYRYRGPRLLFCRRSMIENKYDHHILLYTPAHCITMVDLYAL